MEQTHEIKDFDPANPIYYARNGSPLYPGCRVCGWRMGGVDSWDGIRCKCGHRSASFPELARGWQAAEQAITKASGGSQ